MTMLGLTPRDLDFDRQQRRLEYYRAWYQDHREDQLEKKREYGLVHRKELADKRRAYYAANKERIRAQHRAYNASHVAETAAQVLRWKRSNPDRWKEAVSAGAIHRRFGISMQDAELLVAVRDGDGGWCDVCHRTGLKLVIDHDHETGTVRGILCHRCNHLAQQPRLLSAVLDYVEPRGEGWSVAGN
jgi:hypothetical protein